MVPDLIMIRMPVDAIQLAECFGQGGGRTPLDSRAVQEGEQKKNFGVPRMATVDPAEALRLIEKAVLELQSHYSPSRPSFYALETLHSTVRRTRQEVARDDCGARLRGCS